MRSNKSWRIAGAAMVGAVALLGTSAANAAINLEDDAKDDPAVTYAMETLAAKVGEDDMYYGISGANGVLNVTTVLGVAGAGGSNDDLIVTFNLDGMIFTDDSAVTLSAEDQVTFGAAASGGDEGSTLVVFTAKRGNGSVDAETTVTLNVAQLGIMPGGAGTVSAVIVNPQQRAVLLNIPGIKNPGTHLATYEGAVALKRGLKVTVPPATMPVVRTATVATSFQSFGTEDLDDSLETPETPVLLANLGSLMFSVDPEDILNAEDAESASLMDLIDVGSAAVDDVESGASSVTIMGDFTYAARAWLDDAVACDTTAVDDTADLLAREDGKVTDTTALRPQTPTYVNANTQLCVLARAHSDDDEISIPENTYRAKVKYKAGTDKAAFAPDDSAHDLGSIVRDGTSIAIPFLTSYSGYVQRIILTNTATSGDAIEYWFEVRERMAGVRCPR